MEYLPTAGKPFQSLILLVRTMFQERLAGMVDGRGKASVSWEEVDLVAIKKCIGKAIKLADFRYIAKTPTLQKWYLACLIKVLRRHLKPSKVHIYGFRKFCSTSMISESLRRMLHLSREWGSSIVIISADILKAFGSLNHEVFAEGLLRRGAHPGLVNAFMQEYYDLRGRVSIADSGHSEWFEFSKGGRQGGSETPGLFNTIMEMIAEPLVESWKARGFGWVMDEMDPFTHAVWANNWFLVGKSVEEAMIMMKELTQAVLSSGLRWKPESLEMMTSMAMAQVQGETFVASDGSVINIKAVEVLSVLGILRDRGGNTGTSVDFRLSRAEACFWKNFGVLSVKEGGVRDRLVAFSATVDSTLLHGACGWHCNKKLFDEIKAWENIKLRRMFGMKRIPGEGRFEYNVRASRKIAGWFDKLGLPRLHHRLLQAVFRWAPVTQSWKLECGDTPLKQLWNIRTKASWHEQHEVWLMLDLTNKGKWRHRKPGSLLTWEQLLVDTVGLHWRNLTGDAPAWRKTTSSWMTSACEHLRLQPRAWANSSQEQRHAPHSASVLLSIWKPGDLEQWWRPRNCFEIRLDNQLLARWLQADVRLEGVELAGRLNCILNSIVSVTRCEWSARHPWSHWVQWIPRETNALADALAN